MIFVASSLVNAFLPLSFEVISISSSEWLGIGSFLGALAGSAVYIYDVILGAA